MFQQIQDLENDYPNTWVVLDQALKVVDSSDRLDTLRRKHGPRSKHTFYLVSGDRLAASEVLPSWSLRAVLGYPPLQPMPA
ncbi:MAG: hypothetical protein WC881_12050 [Elusimicrobiota bacterium]|jgi:hypothetical protein